MAEKKINIGQSKLSGNPDKPFRFVIKPKAVKAEMLDDNCFTADKIEPGAVTTDKIAAGAITLDKLSFDITSSILSLITKDINGIWEKISEITGESFDNLSFTVSPQYFISEDPVPVYISALCGDGSVVFDHIAFYINGLKVYEAMGVDSVVYETTISNTSEIKYVATVLGKEYTGSETVVHYNSYWLGAGKSYQEVMTQEHLIPVTTGLRGNYDIHFEQGDQLFIIIGSKLRDQFIRADMNGFEISFDEDTIAIDENSYSVLTSQNAYVEGTYNIDING